MNTDMISTSSEARRRGGRTPRWTGENRRVDWGARVSSERNRWHRMHTASRNSAWHCPTHAATIRRALVSTHIRDNEINQSWHGDSGCVRRSAETFAFPWRISRAKFCRFILKRCEPTCETVGALSCWNMKSSRSKSWQSLVLVTGHSLNDSIDIYRRNAAAPSRHNRPRQDSTSRKLVVTCVFLPINHIRLLSVESSRLVFINKENPFGGFHVILKPQPSWNSITLIKLTFVQLWDSFSKFTFPSL